MFVLSESRVRKSLKADALVLFMLATWTIVIKFLNPICMMWAEARTNGAATGPHILWDFWWIPHLLLAIWLWQRRPRAWEFGILVAAAEILIIVAKFVRYFQNPDAIRFGAPPLLDAFLTNTWFLNKSCVLAFFVVLLFQLVRPEFKHTLRAPPVA